MWHNADMSKQKKSEDIKARVDPWTKANLQHLASLENLDLSDLVRRALREFIDRRGTQQRPA